VNPDATEIWYDGVDQDRRGDADYDRDDDGVDSAEYGGEDCDDEQEACTAVCLDVDGDGACDCSARVAEGAWGERYADAWDLDGDGYPAGWQPGPCDGTIHPVQGWDCDDQDASTYPGCGC
jgi:hypothetical protein